MKSSFIIFFFKSKVVRINLKVMLLLDPKSKAIYGNKFSQKQFYSFYWTPCRIPLQWLNQCVKKKLNYRFKLNSLVTFIKGGHLEISDTHLENGKTRKYVQEMFEEHILKVSCLYLEVHDHLKKTFHAGMHMSSIRVTTLF